MTTWHEYNKSINARIPENISCCICVLSLVLQTHDNTSYPTHDIYRCLCDNINIYYTLTLAETIQLVFRYINHHVHSVHMETQNIITTSYLHETRRDVWSYQLSI